MNKVNWDYVQGFFGGESQIHSTITFYNSNRRVLMEIQKFLEEHGIESHLSKRPEEWKRNIARLNDLDVENISDQWHLTVRKHDALPLRLKLLEKRWRPAGVDEIETIGKKMRERGY